MTAPMLACAEPAPVVLEGRNLTKHFALRRRRIDTGPQRVVHAVDDVTIQLRAGEIVALVGESGSGKSTVARMLAQLQRQTSGEVRLRGEAVKAWRARALRRYCRSVQYVFQDPFASLNPVHSIRHHLVRPLRLHGSSNDLDRRLTELLDLVHLTPAEQFLPKFPHELSGGQRQRVVIARSLATNPAVLLADEPVSMLDVSIRLGILNLLQELQERRRIAILYVTHDMATARYFAQATLVMYAGQLVEGGPSETVVHSPAHPYTQVLLDSAPDPERQDGQGRLRTVGEPVSQVNPGPGCRFSARCPHAMKRCQAESPPAFDLGAGHWARCWLHDGANRAGSGGRADGAAG